MAFSVDILSLLSEYKVQLHIVEPSDEFMNTMILQIHQERINYLRLKADHFQQTMQLATLDTFNNVKSLTIDNFQKPIQIYNIKTYFPNLIYLSLLYNEETYFHSTCKILNLIPASIKRLKLHCISIHCSHYRPDFFFTTIDNRNINIESLVLYMDRTSKSIISRCAQLYNKCLLKTITDFIRVISRIQYIRIIINEGKVDTLLDVDEWLKVVKECRQLNKISIKVLKNISQGTQYVSKIQEIQDGLHNIRESITFQVTVR
jgi:hypothetical protein